MTRVELFNPKYFISGKRMMPCVVHLKYLCVTMARPYLSRVWENVILCNERMITYVL